MSEVKRDKDKRTFPKSSAAREVIARTPEDNKELHEVSSETFNNRKGGMKNAPDSKSDTFTATTWKKPIKPEKGMRKFKGAKSIRKENEEDKLAEELKSYDKYLEKEESFGRDTAED